MRLTVATLVLGLLIGAASQSLSAAEGPGADSAVVGVLADTPESLAVLQRLIRGLDHSEHLRILPIAGKGPVQALTDLVKLRGVDAVMLTSDTLLFMETNGLIPDLGSKVAFAVRLADLDIHVIARDGIDTLADLNGKTIASGPTASSSYVASQLLISAHEISAKILETSRSGAVEAVVAGKADAAILVGAKPLAELRDVKGLHFLGVTAPGSLNGAYSPSLLHHADYPDLIPDKTSIETISSSLVIAASNWPRGTVQYERTRRLVDALFAALQPGRDNAADINFAAKVPGWSRHAAAEDALKQHADRLQTKPDTEN